MTRILLTAFLALPALVSGQMPVGSCVAPFDAPLGDNRRIAMHLRSGDVDIVGTSKPALHVTCEVTQGSADRVRISFAAGNLRIYGGPNRGVRLRIEVPVRTDLLVRFSAGDMRVYGIVGNKDIELHAGDLTIAVEHPEAYRIAEGSVFAGDINAPAFGVSKDGLFPSFRKENSEGEYRLRAKLMAGDLTLK